MPGLRCPRVAVGTVLSPLTTGTSEGHQVSGASRGHMGLLGEHKRWVDPPRPGVVLVPALELPLRTSPALGI